MSSNGNPKADDDEAEILYPPMSKNEAWNRALLQHSLQEHGQKMAQLGEQLEHQSIRLNKVEESVQNLMDQSAEIHEVLLEVLAELKARRKVEG